MRDATFSKRHFHVYPFQPATISTDAIILFIVFLAGYGLAMLRNKK